MAPTLAAEQRVKGLQKAFLFRIEAHPALEGMDPTVFNTLRKKVFRGTFDAFRMGVLGIPTDSSPVWGVFFGWFDNHPEIRALNPDARMEILGDYFRTSLEAFRTGVLVSSDRAEVT